MNTTTVDFETGAKTYQINDLILHVESTRELAKMRDEVYKRNKNPFVEQFKPLFTEARNRYFCLNPLEFSHIKHLTNDQILDFCEYFVEYYNVWKNEQKFN